jgi:predicted DNA-binding transcriptional regulator AlpA
MSVHEYGVSEMVVREEPDKSKRERKPRPKVAPELQIIVMEELTGTVQADETTIRRWCRQGTFPKPIRLGTNKWAG